MKHQRTVFIIPGFRQSPTNRAYTKIAKMLKSEGYTPKLINIPWKKSSIFDKTQYFLNQYKKVKTRKKYILGFSFGAMIAFAASTKVTPSGVILCSLSPYFKEDLDKNELSSKVLAKKVKAKKVHLLYGTKEDKTLIKRVRKTYNQIRGRGKELSAIRQTEHNIGDFRYLNKIHQISKTLN